VASLLLAIFVRLRGGLGHGGMPHCGREYPAHVGGAEAIIGASAESSRPHFFVGNAVIAQDPNALKFTRQGFDVGNRRRLEIEHHGKRPVARYDFVQIRNCEDDVHTMERIGEGSDQSLRDLRITLEENNIAGLHNHLICRHDGGCRGPDEGAGMLSRDGAATAVRPETHL